MTKRHTRGRTARRVGWGASLAVLCWTGAAGSVTHEVETAAELRTAIGAAVAGDVIEVADGTYALDRSIWTANQGTPEAPIVLRAASPRGAKLDFQSVEGLVFNKADWVLEGLWINGACPSPGGCQAAVGIKAGATRFIMRGAKLTNWVQHVKSARTSEAEVEDAQILGCEFTNDGPIDGTPVDIVGGTRWRIANNYVHDFGGDLGNADYGIFIKGATSDSVVENNIVLCGQDRPAYGVTLGISRGGGGTGSQYCPNNDCSCEDTDSIVRNNIVGHCTDACLHTKRACGGSFAHNVAFDCGGGLQVQIDGAGAPVEIAHNVLAGRIYGGSNRTSVGNLERVGNWDALYTDVDALDFTPGTDASTRLGQAPARADVTTDFCGDARPALRSHGPFETDVACTVWPWAFMDDAMGGMDAGPDAGTMDAGVTADAGSVDAGQAMDAGMGIADAGVTPADAGVTRDAGAQTADAGADDSTPQGCSTSGTSGGAGLVELAGLAGLALLGGRRGKKRG